MHRGTRAGLAVALGLAVLAAAVPLGAQGGPPYRIKLPVVIAPEQNLPVLVAHANGYLAEEGIEITDFVAGSGGTLRTAMIAKEFDLGLFGFVHVPIARIGGSPWKAVLSLHDQEIFSLVVRSELRDRVKSVADLRGMTVGFSTPGASSWALGSVYLRKSGLDPEKDVQYVSLGADPTVIYTALKTGKVDAFPSWEPTTTRVIEEGIAFPLVRIWDAEEHRKWIGGKAVSMVLVTREDVLKDRSDLVRRMVAAHKKGLAFVRSKSGAEIAEVVLKNARTAELYKGLDRVLLARMFDRIKPGFGDGCLSRAGIDAEIKLAVDYKLIKRAVTYEEIVDTRFAGECP
jgi:NitT/TauT family transport system substrate-binding protein